MATATKGPKGKGSGAKQGAKAERPPAEAPDQSATEEAVREAAREAEEQGGKGQPDPPPRKRRSRAKAKAAKGPSDEELTAAVTEALSLFSIPVRFVTGCDFCAREHVKDAPEAAAELVELAHEYEPFYNGLVSIYTTLRYLTLAKKGEHLARMGLRPVVHHAAPGPVTAAVGPLVGIPAAEIPEPVPHQHEHPPEPEPEPEQPPTPPEHNGDTPPVPPGAPATPSAAAVANAPQPPSPTP